MFSGLEIPKDTMDILMKTIAQRLTPQPIKLRADIELTCFKPAGIDAIKRALKAGEAVSTPTVPVKAKLVAPPFYVLDTNATDKVTSPHVPCSSCDPFLIILDCRVSSDWLYRSLLSIDFFCSTTSTSPTQSY